MEGASRTSSNGVLLHHLCAPYGSERVYDLKPERGRTQTTVVIDPTSLFTQERDFLPWLGVHHVAVIHQLNLPVLYQSAIMAQAYGHYAIPFPGVDLGAE